PAFLAFGPLVHTDVALTLFSLLALWTFSSLWREPTRGNVLRFALSLAGALLSKFTAGVLFFAFAVFVLSLRLRRVPGTPEGKAEARDWRRARLRATLLGALGSALIVYVFYLVFSWHQPSDALYRLGTGPLALFFRRVLLPLVLLILLLAPVPRMLGGAERSGVTVGGVAVAVLAASCLFTAVRAYPYYFPFINSLGLGHPAYELVNDSNVDWNQSLPELERFVEQHGLQRIAVDEYGFSDPTVFVPRAHVWNCQTPAPEDLGQWVALSANMILDGHNCQWLMQYPHEALAG